MGKQTGHADARGNAYAPVYFVAFLRKVDIEIYFGNGDPDRWRVDIDRESQVQVINRQPRERYETV
jgi:hypothetical protein